MSCNIRMPNAKARLTLVESREQGTTVMADMTRPSLESSNFE